MFFLIDVVQVDKMVAVFFDKLCGSKVTLLSLLNQVKWNQALLGSNLSGIVLMTNKKSKKRSSFKDSFFDIFGGLYACKNPSINFFFLVIDNPLWFLSLFFKSAKWPSRALVVFGISSSILSYHVNSQNRLVFRLL